MNAIRRSKRDWAFHVANSTFIVWNIVFGITDGHWWSWACAAFNASGIAYQERVHGRIKAMNAGAPAPRGVYSRWQDCRHAQALRGLAPILAANPDQRWFAYTLSRKSGVRTGLLYPALQRMLDEGWLTYGWESDTEAAGRPPRRWYRLTPRGRSQLVELGEWVLRS